MHPIFLNHHRIDYFRIGGLFFAVLDSTQVVGGFPSEAMRAEAILQTMEQHARSLPRLVA